MNTATTAGNRSPLRRLLWPTFLTGLAAFVLSVALMGLLDFGLIGGVPWIHQTRIPLLNGVPASPFIHAAALELAYLIPLSLSVLVADRLLLNKHVFGHVFLSFLFFEVYALFFYPIWWHSVGFSTFESAPAWLLFALPIPGAANYAIRLLTAAALARARGLEAWVSVPWWSVFAPTASFLLAALILLPFHLLTQ